MDLENFNIEGNTISNYLQVFDLKYTRSLMLKGNPSMCLYALVRALNAKNENAVSYLNLSNTPFHVEQLQQLFGHLSNTNIVSLDISKSYYDDTSAKVIANSISKLSRIDVFMEGNEITSHVT